MTHQRGLILELSSGTVLNDHQFEARPFLERVGLIVTDHHTAPVNCREVMRQLPIPCAGIAFVTDVRLRYTRRMGVEMALSLDHGCPCRVFGDSTQARMWLEQRLAI